MDALWDPIASGTRSCLGRVGVRSQSGGPEDSPFVLVYLSYFRDEDLKPTAPPLRRSFYSLSVPVPLLVIAQDVPSIPTDRDSSPSLPALPRDAPRI